MYTIEYIGTTGIITTAIQKRITQKPRAGDVVTWPDGSPYPFNGTHGRISNIDSEKISLCVGGCSVFLVSEDAVSISGGPFARVKISDLTTSPSAIVQASFWNWGDNGAGGGHGVHFDLPRLSWHIENPGI